MLFCPIFCVSWGQNKRSMTSDPKTSAACKISASISNFKTKYPERVAKKEKKLRKIQNVPRKSGF